MTTFTPLTHQPFKVGLAPIEQAQDSIWLVRGFSEARQIMLADVRQAGFKAEIIDDIPGFMTKPVLYQHGATHREQRGQTSRFFTPTVVQQRYMPLIEETVDRILDQFKQAGRADLNHLTALLATSVVAEVVGLTASPSPALASRLDRILHADLKYEKSLLGFLRSTRVQSFTLWFYLRDVLPAIRARRKAPKEDVISYLISKNYKNPEILAECITYGAAGMVTTQEFICVAAWHCLKDPALKARMLNPEREARYRLLHEILRLEPVVGHLYRRAATDLQIESGAETVTIPAGAMIDMDLGAINADARVVGAEPLDLNADRPMEKGIPGSVMGFGSGPHRCAGEHIAIAETDVFLQKLLAIPGLAIEQAPKLGHNDTIKGYELREFWLTIQG